MKAVYLFIILNNDSHIAPAEKTQSNLFKKLVFKEQPENPKINQ